MPHRTPRIALALGLAALAAWPADAAQPTVDRRIAVLQALDKITAQISRLEVPVGEQATFGTLSMAVRACRTTLPEEAPDNAAFLEIYDEPPGGEPGQVFAGWMFSSSPAVSALDHAVYDIWVVACADTIALPEAEEAYERGLYNLPDAPPRPEPPPDGRIDQGEPVSPD